MSQSNFRAHFEEANNTIVTGTLNLNGTKEQLSSAPGRPSLKFGVASSTTGTQVTPLGPQAPNLAFPIPFSGTQVLYLGSQLPHLGRQAPINLRPKLPHLTKFQMCVCARAPQGGAQIPHVGPHVPHLCAQVSHLRTQNRSCAPRHDPKVDLGWVPKCGICVLEHGTREPKCIATRIVVVRPQDHHNTG